MAENEAPEKGHNLTQIKLAVKKASDQVRALKADNSANNTEIREIKAKLETMGITRRAFNRALADKEAFDANESPDEAKANTEAEDQAYTIAREAMGLPTQMEFNL